MNSQELSILLRLILAHLLGDFLFQPNSWVQAKNKQKEKAPQLYYHVAVVTLLTYLFLADWKNWKIPLVIATSHLLIDIWKSHKPSTFRYFMIDQALHWAVIALIWLITYLPDFGKLYSSIDLQHVWVLVTAYYLVIGPLGIAIGQATAKWQKEAGMETGGLSKAGMWIGKCERVLVLTFIVTNQYTALGFLMAAKSLLRFGHGEDSTQKKTEYILVGTLISFASAAIIGVITNYLLQHFN